MQWRGVRPHSHQIRDLSASPTAGQQLQRRWRWRVQLRHSSPAAANQAAQVPITGRATPPVGFVPQFDNCSASFVEHGGMGGRGRAPTALA